MKLRFHKKRLSYLSIFMLAIFNDVIRIPGTPITGFRIAIPFALLICIQYHKTLRHYFKLYFAFIILLVPQYAFYTYGLNLDGKINFEHMLSYAFYYLSIVLVLALVHIISSEDKQFFNDIFEKYIPIFGITTAIVYLLIPSLRLNTALNIANRNNYAVAMAASAPVYMLLGRRKKLYYIVPLIMMIEMYTYGSKSAFVGIAIEYMLFIIIVNADFFKQKLPIVTMGMIIGIVLLVLAINSPFKIHGYLLRDEVEMFLFKIIRGEMYNTLDYTSVTYRTDTILQILKGIKDSFFIGIGAGNSGRYLFHTLPNARIATTIDSVSPHCFYLELMLDNGLWMIVLQLVVFFKAVIGVFHLENIYEGKAYFIIFTLSLPVWMLSASGCYTIYLLYICIAWIYESYRNIRNPGASRVEK